MKRLNEKSDIKIVTTDNRMRSQLIPQQPHHPAHSTRLMTDLQLSVHFALN